jgi:hypothetical protein
VAFQSDVISHSFNAEIAFSCMLKRPFERLAQATWLGGFPILSSHWVSPFPLFVAASKQIPFLRLGNGVATS